MEPRSSKNTPVLYQLIWYKDEDWILFWEERDTHEISDITLINHNDITFDRNHFSNKNIILLGVRTISGQIVVNIENLVERRLTVQRITSSSPCFSHYTAVL